MNLAYFRRYTSSKHYIPELDGLRFLAIITVLLFHSGNRLITLLPSQQYVVADFLKGGFLGVELFFAISGYILTSQILHLYSQKKFSYGDYLARRIRRIEPPFVISTIAIFFIWFFFSSYSRQELANSLVNVITYTSNF